MKPEQLSLLQHPWLDAAALLIKQLARTGHAFVANDLVSRLGEPEHHQHIGAALASARNAGLIEVVGYRLSDRANASTIVREWRGVST